MELEPAYLGIQAFHVFLDRPGGIFVRVRHRELEELGRIPERRIGPIDRIDDTLETDALAPETLRPLLICPYRGVLQIALDRGELLAFGRDVKDTP